jgi:hypothetical protein
MIASRWTWPAHLHALLEHERRLAPVPAGVRMRALARARASLETPAAASPRPSPRATKAPPLSRWLAAAGLVFAASAAGGVAAYELGLRARTIPIVVDDDEGPLPSPPERDQSATSPVEPTGSASLPPVAPPRSNAAAARAELRLLGRARAAVVREEFATALLPLAEHARRFKNGRLTEEREALRVKALAGLGRDDEARRAAAAFEARFPRSPLVSAVGRMSASRP